MNFLFTKEALLNRVRGHLSVIPNCSPGRYSLSEYAANLN